LAQKLAYKCSLSGGSGNGSSSGNGGFDWESLGIAAGVCFNACPSGVTFLHGPLQADYVPKTPCQLAKRAMEKEFAALFATGMEVVLPKNVATVEDGEMKPRARKQQNDTRNGGTNLRTSDHNLQSAKQLKERTVGNESNSTIEDNDNPKEGSERGIGSMHDVIPGNDDADGHDKLKNNDDGEERAMEEKENADRTSSSNIVDSMDEKEKEKQDEPEKEGEEKQVEPEVEGKEMEISCQNGNNDRPNNVTGLVPGDGEQLTPISSAEGNS
jgi:hypothetical protein